MPSSYFANADYTDSKHFISINLEESGIVHILENEFSISIISEYPCISSNVTSKSVNKLLAPMPGLLKDILCTEGKRVRKGETLFVLEAMKMENSIKAPVHGMVSKVSTQIGKAI